MKSRARSPNAAPNGNSCLPTEFWDTSCPDWRDRIRNGRSLLPPLPLRKRQAERAQQMYDMLRIPDIIGQPRLADAGAEWQRDLVRAIFGSYDPSNNVRYIKEFFCLLPKKSSKTMTGAAIMLVALMMNQRPNAEFLLVAPRQEISKRAFRNITGMIDADPVLKNKFHTAEHIKCIRYLQTGARLTVKSFDPKIITGANHCGVLLDELHVIAEDISADRVIGQIRGGMMPFPEAFILTITTQSERPPAGVFKTEIEKARQVRDGRLSLPVLPMLYEFPEDVDWKDPENWWMVSPNRGLSMHIQELVTDYRAAELAGPAEVARWASQHLNVQIGAMLRSGSWPGAEYWEDATDASLTLETLISRSDVIVAGIDGGGLDDLLALAFIGRDAATRKWLAWVRCWAHHKVLDRHKAIGGLLRDFVADGDLVLVDDLEKAYRELAQLCGQINETGLLAQIGIDPMGVGGIVSALGIEGMAGDEMIVGIRQGWTLNGAIKTAEVRLSSRSLLHARQGIMTWAVGSARVETKGNAIVMTKETAGAGKIDPVMALLDAIVLMSRDPEAKGGSIFDDKSYYDIVGIPERDGARTGETRNAMDQEGGWRVLRAGDWLGF